jgi:hypothetical protein
VVHFWTPLHNGSTIARPWLKKESRLPKSSVCGLAKAKHEAAAMDVDRIAPMGGVGQEQNPSWTREKMRRRKFAEDVEKEVDGEPQPGPAEEEDHDGSLNVIA